MDVLIYLAATIMLAIGAYLAQQSEETVRARYVSRVQRRKMRAKQRTGVFPLLIGLLALVGFLAIFSPQAAIVVAIGFGVPILFAACM